MATLVLTAVGMAVGGPLGASIGAMIGRSVDSMIFAPKGRQGPRLGDLSVQTSSYGSALPRLFGTMRVAGTVVWATDLIETRQRSGGGKGKPKTTTYSYASSFAVALSARPIRAVYRIWADGKLLRGADGDWKSSVGAFRVRLGDEAQAVDPLIAADKGADAPAFRGLALAVFDQLQLADFGNRIPSLTFEVEADAGDISLLDVVQELAGTSVGGTTSSTLTGFAASGDSVRGALETLLDIHGVTLVDDGSQLRLVGDDGDALPLPGADLAAQRHDEGERADRITTEQAAASTLADAVGITFYDPARDYQTGLQQASRRGCTARADKVELPVALSASRAKELAEQLLARRWRARATAKVQLPWRWLGLRPGDRVALPGRSGQWRITERAIEQGLVTLDLVAAARTSGLAGSAAGVPADPGSALGAPDLRHGRTAIVAIDAALFDDSATDTPRYWIAAAGHEPGWRQAALAVSGDGGARWTDLGTTAPSALMGETESALPAGSATLQDGVNQLTVALLHEDMWLESTDETGLRAGNNLALVGSELLQFGDVTPLGGGRFRLSRLWRGRMGTEWAMHDHAGGEAFVLIERDSLVTVEPGRSALNSSLSLMASGVGDATAATALLAYQGRNVLPPAPVRLVATAAASGDLRLVWVRRDRAGFGWSDGADVAMSEASAQWQVDVKRDGELLRSINCGETAWTYAATWRRQDGTDHGAAFTLHVRQIGSFGQSEAALLSCQP